jgi:tight adherence protein B
MLGLIVEGLMAVCVLGCAAATGYLVWWHTLQTATVLAERLDRQHVAIPVNRIMRLLVSACILIGLLVFAFTRNGVVGAAVGLAFSLLPGQMIQVIERRNRDRFAAQFVDVLLLINNCLRAGLNMERAMVVVSSEMPRPSRDEFGMMMRQVKLGMPLDDVLEGLTRRQPGESVQIFVTAVQVNRQTGGEITKLFDILIRMIREKERVRDKVRTMTAEGRGQAYTIAAFPIVAFLVRYMLNPENVLGMFHSVWGVSLIGVGVTLDVLGLLAVRRLATVKT